MIKPPNIWTVLLGVVITAGLSGAIHEVNWRPLFRDSPPAQVEIVSMPYAGEVRDGWRYRGGDPSDKANWEPATTPPKIGEIQQGYRYKGGDPAKQTNWERAP